MTINNIQKHNRMYNENSKLNEMFLKNDINYIVQFTQFHLQFTTSFFIVKKYNQDAKVELLKKIFHERNITFINVRINL